ncbi:HlyD family secretion protein [Aquamicrobium sp.]|uniref:HlyD family secretion protein n=1 Tax=Aquamicrobium sp. TaxID=1872579 RepID=UPI00258260EA|nr:HlyD family secretion protein [Aquamicrobium sp.]MCK9553318.1 HlyD family secretion protein [Aquamicrobium sp.]
MDKVVELRKDENEQAERLKPEAAPAASEAVKRRTSGRSMRGGRAKLLVLVVGLVVAALVIWPWLAHRWSHVAINDSRIAANLVTVGSEVSGRVVSIDVIAGDQVKKGDLLASIDSETARLELSALDAQIEGVNAQQAQLRAQQDMVRTQVAAKLAAGEAQLTAAEANHRASQASLTNASSRFERVNRLASSKVTSEQTLEEAQATLSTATEQEKSAAAAIMTARANLDVARSEEAQIAVLDRQIAVLESQKAALVAQRGQKEVDLGRREIRAQFDGVIDSTFIEAGEYVGPGTRLLIYHDPNVIWIDANVKETDFGRVKLGAPAAVTVDAYPQLKVSGKVTRVGEAATSQFALLPSPNPSGNFTKITQRLPIRIEIDQQEGLLRPGMMVEVSVDVVN